LGTSVGGKETLTSNPFLSELTFSITKEGEEKVH
jgi:hypothetical protein